MEMMLLGTADALVMTLEILSGLECTQIVLLSSAIIVASQDFFWPSEWVKFKRVDRRRGG